MKLVFGYFLHEFGLFVFMTDIQKLNSLYDNLEDNALLSKSDLRDAFNKYSYILNSYRDKGQENKDDTMGLKGHLFQISQWITGAKNKSGDDYFERARVDLSNDIRSLITFLSKEGKDM